MTREKFPRRPALIYSPEYQADIGAHVFPMEKYALVFSRLREEGILEQVDLLSPEPASRASLALAHTRAYLDSLFSLRWDHHTKFSELPLTREIVEAYLLASEGTVLAARESLARKLAANLGGGFHHAMSDRAEGFCYINDLAVAIRVLQHEKRIRKAAVIDCDLHQGNGTARIFQDDPSVYTFSMHQENLYPPKERSTKDIGLRDFTRDDEYLRLLSQALPEILDQFHPEIVLYQAGADPYEEDLLGCLRITMEGLQKRDAMVIEGCAERGIPVAVTLGGGYAMDTRDTVAIHCNTIRALCSTIKASR